MKEITDNETRKHILKVNALISLMICSLIERSLKHDSSKLGDVEGPIFDEFTPKLSGSTYGSDEYKSFLKEMSVALDHHYKENRHHPEHFDNGIKGMSLIDLVEMLCDWKAATLRHDNGDIIKSINVNQERFGYSDELKGILLNTIKDLGWEERE